MKILFVTLFLPLEKSYHAGGRHVYEILQRLSKRHEVYLATRLEESELPMLKGLAFCREIYPYTYSTSPQRGLLNSLKLILNYFLFSRYADRVIRKGNFDMVQVEWTEAAIAIKKRAVPMVLDAHDVITKPAERQFRTKSGLIKAVLFIKYLVIKALELRTVRKFDAIFTLSDFDKNYLLSIAPGLRVEVAPVPAGLDINERHFGKEQDTILFLASYKYRQVNVDSALYFYNSIFPLVRKEIPDAKFVIAGYGPPRELKALAERDPNVLVPGFVDDLNELYRRASVFAAPILIGGGIIVKILDAMAAGTPVVTTSYGNEGIAAVPGRDLVVADDPESFAAAVTKVLKDPEFARRLSKNAKNFVTTNFSSDAVIEKIESSYAAILKCGARTIKEA